MPDLTLPVDIKAEDGRLLARLEEGAAAGPYVTLRLYRGDIINVRNIQGGVEGDLNLDISAGGEGDLAGALSLQYDNGSDTVIYDGKGHPLLRAYGARHTNRALHSDVKHYLHAGAWVPKVGGGWRQL